MMLQCTSEKAILDKFIAYLANLSFQLFCLPSDSFFNFPSVQKVENDCFAIAAFQLNLFTEIA